MVRKKQLLSGAVRGLPVLVALAIVAEVIIRSDDYQWDFKAYYHAVAADEQGFDPYDAAMVREVANDQNVFPFLYPPLTLICFQPFAELPYTTAYFVWLALKLILITVLLYVWKRHFFRDEKWWVFFLFSVFAFGAALSLDIQSGNVTIIEQVLLWMAFYCLVVRKMFLFCLLVIASSVFKWTSAAFLILLLLDRSPRRWLHFFGSVAGFLAIVAVNYVLSPDRFERFISVAMMRHETGRQDNPSTLALIEFGAGQFSRLGLNEAAISNLSLAAYVIVIGAVFWWTARHIRPLLNKQSAHNSVYLIYTACFAYALMLPRFKLYSFILLIPAALYVIRNCIKGDSFWILFILVALSIDPKLPGQSILSGLWYYYPLLVTFVLWIIWLAFLKRVHQQPEPTHR